MEKKTRTALVLVLLLVVGAGIGYAVIDSYDVSQGATWDASDEGPEVTLLEETEQVAERPLPDRHTVDLAPHGQLHSDGETSMEISGHVDSDFVTLTNIQTNGNEISATMTDQPDVTFSGDVDHIEWREVNTGTDSLDFAHNGDIEIVVDVGGSANGYLAKDAESGETLDTDTSGGSTATFSLQGQNEVTIVEPEGPPQIDADSVEPNSPETLTDIPFNMSAAVSDPDETNLDVEFIVEGETVGSDTVTGEGVAEIEHDENIAGEYDWEVRATDEFGQTTTESGFKFYLPDELEIRDITEPGEPIQNDIEIRVRFFTPDAEEVVTRTTQDGVVDLSGLPADKPILIEIDDNQDEYVPRQTLLKSLTTQQNAFVLPVTQDSAEIDFLVEDDTSRFGASENARFIVEKPIEIDGETQFRRVSGDFLGPSATFSTILEDDERYRLRVINEDGEERSLGEYRVSGADQQVIPIGSVEFTSDIDDGAGFQASVRDAPEEATHDHEIRVTYIDQRDLTDQFDLTITVGDETVHEATMIGPYGQFVETIPLEEDQFDPDSDTAVVTVEADRDGETVEFERAVGELSDIFDGAHINPTILELMGWLSILAVIGLLVIVSPPMAAVVGTGWAALVTMTGIVSIPMAAIALAGSTAVLYAMGGGGLR